MKPSHVRREDIVSHAPIIDKLIEYPMIEDLDPTDIEAIYPYLLENEFPDGTVILKQGQAAESFHIVLEGQLDILLDKERQISVAKLSAGQFFGEMSCLTGNAVSATVKTIGLVRTLSMPKQGILLLMDRNASFRKHMIEEMVNRISDSNQRVVEENTRGLAVMRQLESERKVQYGQLVGNSPFMQSLRQRIKELSEVEAPICIVGEKGVGKFHAAYEIHHLSRRRQHPILSVDGDNFSMEEWEMKVQAAKEGTIVLEHADLLEDDLLQRLMQMTKGTRCIMTAQQTPRLKLHDLLIVPLRERAEDIPALVYAFISAAGVAQPEEMISRDAMSMLSAYPYLSGNIKELKRVVEDALVISGGKFILDKHLRFGAVREPGTRPKIGLALGSGASRGAAHVGVLKVLEEANIPIDLIAGTSVGAFIGALYAGGQTIAAFERVLPTVRWGQLLHPTLPTQAFASNHPMIRFVERYIGSVNFEDLPIPFAAVASDARNGEAVILNKGKVSHAICATTAIPGIMKPVKYGDRILLDGAVAHPVPVALAKSMGADIVIAVDVTIPAFAKREPKNFVTTILNTIDFMSEKIVEEETQLADIVLRPPLETNQITFKSSLDYIEAGAKVTRESLEAIKRKIELA